MKIRLLSLLRKLLIDCRQPWRTVLRSLSRLIERLLSNPYIADLWRFIFLGTLVETGRVVGQKVVDAVSSFFVVCYPRMQFRQSGDVTPYLSDYCFLLFRRFRI